ncbi:hypothetical protein ACFSR7_15535 [Cohnella sp. GCM10020058]|uniref:hypothetical protein n=1 Tax=Cohnella sp. GCM10020058 TaxID=3317330 RepID=UPI0036254557
MMHFPDRATVIRKSTDPDDIDPFGNVPDGDTVTMPCRIDETSKVVKDSRGQEVVSSVQLYFPAWATVPHTDEVEYKTGAGVLARRSPISVELLRNNIGMPMILAVNC